MTEQEILDRVDKSVQGAKAGFSKAAEPVQGYAIKLIPEAGGRLKMYLLLGALLASVACYFWLKPVPPSLGVVRPSAAIPELRKIPKITIKGQDVEIYDGDGGFTLPPTSPSTAKITGSADLGPSKGGYKVVATFDPPTGKTELVQKEKPQPFFGIGGETAIGIRAGFTTGGQGAQVYARQDLLRLSNVYISGYTEATLVTNTAVKPDAKAMIDISYRW